MKKVQNILLIFVLLLSLITFASCKKEEKKFKVNFKYESGEIITSLDVLENEEVRVDTPTLVGHTFNGWYVEGAAVTFPTTFNKDTDVIAKFEKNKYTYKFMVDGSILKEVEAYYGDEIVYPENPTKLDSNGISYTFKSWDNDATKLYENVVFNAIFESTEIIYTYTFLNEDGSVLYTNTGKYNDAIIYPESPSKLEDNEYTYSFVGWDHQDEVLTSNVTFKPIFDGVKKEYTYTFLDANGEVYHSGKGYYNSEIVYPNNHPVKQGTDKFSYEFSGWDNDDTVLTKDIIFTPSYNEVINKYTYKFIDASGEVLKEETLEYGSTIIYPESPTKDKDQEYTYTFSGWDKDDTILTKDITFKPIFDGVKNKYTYRFVDSDDSIIKEETVDYGTMPVAPSMSDIEGAKFAGWDKEIEIVTCDVTYKAVYTLIPTSLANLKVSILGDSISTFYAEGSVMNSYYGGENQFYYPRYSATIKTVEKTWWYQLITNNNMTLGINNSWSGSCAYGTSSSAGMTDGRIDTLDNNGEPNVVLIYLGTNDCASGYTVEQFGEAIETIIKKVSSRTTADIFITTLGYTAYTGSKYSEARRVEYNAKIRSLASEYGCGIVPLDEYIVDTSYSFYLGDNLHYNAKGAELLSLIYEKSIKEYYGISFDKEINVEHKEALPEGVLGKVTATSNSNFWGNYENHVFLAKSSSFISPQYSFRIEIKFDSATNNYVVSAIHKSGATVTYNSDFVLVVSDSHTSNKAVLADLEKVVVGSIVEFDTTLSFPVEVIFKESSNTGGGAVTPNPPVEEDKEKEGMLHVGAYNTGVWTLFDTTAIIYSYEKMDKTSTYINFYLMGLTLDGDTNTYKVTYMKDYGVTSTHPECDYYLLIYGELSQKSFYASSKVGTTVTVTGDITSGDCYLEFK